MNTLFKSFLLLCGVFFLTLSLGQAMPAMPQDLAGGKGAGEPILIITSTSNPFGNYYAKILQNEGLNTFSASDISTVSPATLASYDVVLLADMPLTPAQVTIFSDWVNSGGNLIAMHPDNKLASLLGLIDMGTPVANGYLLVDTSKAPGGGLVNQTIQFHGDANRYTLNGAASVATLYTDASTATANPAVTLRSVGGGKAAAFSYDLARSIVYTRLGNALGEPKTDLIDLNKVAIPQADEQQRLLANLITEINQSKKPLPRFWYLPRGEKAVVLMTGHDQANGGTAGRFNQFKVQSPAGCSVNNWECIRGTSYIYPNTALTDAQAAAFNTDGFEIALQLNTGCEDFTPSLLEFFYTQQLKNFSGSFPSLPAPSTQRYTQQLGNFNNSFPSLPTPSTQQQCLVKSDWVTAARVGLSKGIRFNTTSYRPSSLIFDRPGFFTGSGMPMPLADLEGNILDVYETNTQMTDESGQSSPSSIDALLDKALGAEGFYGAFTVSANTDSVSDAVVASAKTRGVPVVSARQMLTWLDGRNTSSFGSLAWSNNSLSFTITPGTGANGLQAMLPAQSGNSVLSSITVGGTPVIYTTEVIKGINYALFSGQAGSYVATYSSDTTAPTVSSTTPTNGATNISTGTTLTATFSEAMDPATISTSTFELRNPANALVTATVSYDPASKTATLTPSNALAASTTYTATVKGGTTDPRVKDLAGNALAANFSWSFTTGAAPCTQQPCSIWPSTTTPTNPSNPDTAAVEVGVKFRSDVNGFITGIRFYKGSGNTGTHVGTLWSSTGTQLARATFSSETASGWQQVTFATPVAVTANTTYVASYHTNVGRYAADGNFFATVGVDNAPLHALSNGVGAGNGVYRYSATPIFPNANFQSTNYWVDVLFTTVTAPDTTAPTVSATTPTSAATNVNIGTTVTATFSEAMDPATISTSTFELRNPANALVMATVSYDAASKTVTLTPSSALAISTTYTATVKGGTTDPRVKDLAGNALAANFSWSFTTGTAPCSQQLCSIWPSTATPTNPSENDTAAVEVGVKFRSDVSGRITGIRFYKGSGNTGTHVGTLWSSTGTQLARATFSGETVSGWQQVTFATPVAVTANTTYVASYHTNVGRYAADGNFFATVGVDNAPLHALSNGVGAGNGVYRYSATPAFPNLTFQSTNYWVDVVFATP